MSQILNYIRPSHILSNLPNTEQCPQLKILRNPTYLFGYLDNGWRHDMFDTGHLDDVITAFLLPRKTLHRHIHRRRLFRPNFKNNLKSPRLN